MFKHVKQSSVYTLSTTIILFSLVLSNISLGQEAVMISKQDRLEAKRLFKNAHNSWEILWNENAGVPTSMLGNPLKRFSGNPMSKANTFFKEQSVLLGIKSLRNQLKLLSEETTDRGHTILRFRQLHEGVPVNGSGYDVAFLNGDIFYVSGAFYPDINIPVAPKITKNSVLDKVLSIRQFSGNYSTSQPELVIAVKESAGTLHYSLVYKIRVGNWLYHVNAKNGNIDSETWLGFRYGGGVPDRPIKSKNSIKHAESLSVSGLEYEKSEALSFLDFKKRFATAPGKVYLSNPLHGSPVQVTLNNLVNVNTIARSGQWEFANEQGPMPSGGNYIYNPTDTEFNVISAYYHMDKFNDWLITKGMPSNTITNFRARVNQARSGKSSGPAQFVRFDQILNKPSINLGRENTSLNSEWRATAIEAAIVTHEFMHFVTFRLHPTFVKGASQNDSIHESISDYFAVGYKQNFASSTVIGEGIDIPGGNVTWKRNLNHSYRYTDVHTIDLWGDGNGEPNGHDVAIMLTGAMWDVRSHPSVNASIFDAIVLHMVRFYMTDIMRFENIRFALQAATIACGYGSYSGIVNSAFDAKGIYPIKTWITGPTQVEAITEWGTWTAHSNYSGIGPWNGEWWIEEEGVWSSLGETGTTLTMLMDVDATLKYKLYDTQPSVASYNWTTFDVTVTGGGLPKTSSSLPREFKLEQNYPNPFNPITEIKYQLRESEFVTIKVYNITGQIVATLVNENKPAGFHSVKFDASNLASGFYVYKIQAGSFSDVKRMTLIK